VHENGRQWKRARNSDAGRMLPRVTLASGTAELPKELRHTMSQEAYRSPEAPLIHRDGREPRSAVVAVVLGFVVNIAASIGVGVAGVLFQRPEAVTQGPSSVWANAGIGFLGGWSAARYRRGPWRGVTLAVVSLDVLGGVAGGYTGRGWRTTPAGPR
jgi:hypothetical protein